MNKKQICSTCGGLIIGLALWSSPAMEPSIEKLCECHPTKSYHATEKPVAPEYYGISATLTSTLGTSASVLSVKNMMENLKDSDLS